MEKICELGSEKNYTDNDLVQSIENVKKAKSNYEYCADGIRKDSRFVKALIEFYKDDIDFLEKVVVSYFGGVLDVYGNIGVSLENMEIMISLYNLINLKSPIKKPMYYLYMDELYGLMMYNLKEDTSKDSVLADEFGMGFLILMEKYKKSQIIVDFIAKKMLEILFCKDGNMKRIFQDYKKDGTIGKEARRNFIIDYVRKYDAALASYISIERHRGLFFDIENALEKEERDWNSRIEYYNSLKIGILWQEAENFVNDVLRDTTIQSFDVVDYTVRKLGLEEFMGKYDATDPDGDYYEFGDDFDYFALSDYYEQSDADYGYTGNFEDDLNFSINEEELSPDEKQHLDKFVSYIYEKLFASDLVDMTPDDYGRPVYKMKKRTPESTTKGMGNK